MRRFRTLFLALLFCNGLHGDALPEYTMKAAYLYNFALLTDWPDQEKSDYFMICFYKHDLGEASDLLNNKTLHNQTVRITTISSLKGAKECNMIFIRETEAPKVQGLIGALSDAPVLIVSETPTVADAHIRILKENRKLAFDVNLKPIKESDLSVSSRLLKLARRVEP